MLRVGIDGIIYNLQEGGGVSVYFSELIQFLADVPDLAVDLWMFEPSRAHEPLVVSPQHRRVVSAMRRCERYRACRLEGGRRPDVFHSSYYRLPDDATVPSVVTVHDFAYETFRRGPALWVHEWQKWSAIRAAKVVICVSQATADDLLKFVGLRSHQILKVIHNGVSDVFESSLSTVVDSRQLLYVGGRGGYKNFRLVLGALNLLPDFRLICVGGGPLRDDEFTGFSVNVRKRVTHRGFVSNIELANLYQNSQCLVYPSSFEGFGIPVAEAMRSGCPVVGLTACKAVVEVAGDALCGVDEMEAAVLARKIEYLSDHKYRESLVCRGLARGNSYSWRISHEKTLDAYRVAAERSH